MFILSLSSCARPRGFQLQEGIASVIMRKYYTAKHAMIYIICCGITGNERTQLRKKSQNKCVVSCKTETDGVPELKFQTKISFFLSEPTPASVKTSKSSQIFWSFAFSVILNAFRFGWQKTCPLGLTSPKVILCGWFRVVWIGHLPGASAGDLPDFCQQNHPGASSSLCRQFLWRAMM